MANIKIRNKEGGVLGQVNGDVFSATQSDGASGIVRIVSQDAVDFRNPLVELTGAFGRTVILEATGSANTNSEFVEWVISYEEQQELRIFATVSSVASDIATVCGDSRQALSQLAVILYTDGERLYTDMFGTRPAPLGFYGTGNGSYYDYRGVVPPQAPIQCPTPSGGGGGGSRLVDTSLI
jgi:hypothetical protein